MAHFTKIGYCLVLLLSAVMANAQKRIPAISRFNGAALLQQDSMVTVHINKIEVKGNRKTKTYIILRETPLKTGDTMSIAGLGKRLEQARIQVYNTTLFDWVQVDAIVNADAGIDISIQVKERWFVYPIPQFQLVDRNFNDWYYTFNHSLNRVNYGLKFAHYNLSGRRDQLRVYLINGYSRNISFTYSNPYSNKALNRGFSIAAGYTQNREIAYMVSSNNKLLFYPTDSIRKKTNDFVRNSWYISASYLLRQGYFTRQYFSAGYAFLKVDDSVIHKNPAYFKDSVNSKTYFDMAYTYQCANVDNSSYPLKGKSFYASVLKRGLGFTGGLNMLSIEGGYNRYYALGKKWYAAVLLNGKVKLPFDQAYINQRGLGYGETYLRGLEYYVIDGVAYGLVKSTLKKKLFAFNIPFPFFPRVLTRIPFTFYGKSFADLGYVYSKPKYDTYLNNRLLYSGGLGIDILTLYDINLRFEYSFNQLGKSGLFFHTQNGF